MEKPLVTVVVGCYNHSRYIVECLNSIKAQTYNNIELLIGDDASPDNSVEVIDQWLQENNYPAKTVYHDKNTGVVKMLNECMEHVHGKHVKFIAADDFLHPDCISRSVTELEKYGDEYGMIFTDIFTVDENSNRITDFADYNALGLVDREVFRREQKKINRIAAISTLVRTDVMRETGPYSEDFFLEDYYKWLQINERYYIGYVSEKLCYYRLHNENISKKKAQQIADETLILNIMFDRNGESSKYINEMVMASYYNRGITNNERLLKTFISYPYKNKVLEFAVKNRLPFNIFRIFKYILWRN